jgi:hypothetical protein
VEPSKHTDHAIVELLDVLLRDGAVVRADAVVTVADIPLIGISLHAAIAGMATMTNHGLFTEWDEVVRSPDRAAGRSQTRHGD